MGEENRKFVGRGDQSEIKRLGLSRIRSQEHTTVVDSLTKL